MTIFFKKVALALLHCHCTAAAVAAPTQEAAALARRQPLCQGAAIPTAGTSTGAAPSSAAAAGGRPCRRQPLRAVPLPAGCLPTGAEPEVGYPLRAGRGLAAGGRLQTISSSPCGVAVGGCRPLRAPGYSRPPSGGCPCGLVAGGRHPLVGWPWPQPAAPLQGALPQPAAPLHRGLGCSRSPLQGGLGCSRPPPCRWPTAPTRGWLWPCPTTPCKGFLRYENAARTSRTFSTQFNLITRSLKQIFCTKTLALIPLLGNLQQIRLKKMREVKRPPL
ncbi:hypothetical protein BHE74_00052694 [Ensete ventricosum]|nr:hypothetical protein BHE74_00052694 [Ensete ventricosum]